MKVMILSGSIGQHSCTRTLLCYIEKRLKAQGVETVWWDLGDKALPIAVPEYHTNQQNHPEQIVREFDAAVKSSDGFVLGSPLYHDSYSGVLKNALDNLQTKPLPINQSDSSVTVVTSEAVYHRVTSYDLSCARWRATQLSCR